MISGFCLVSIDGNGAEFSFFMSDLGMSTGRAAPGNENEGGEAEKSMSMGISAEGVEADEESVEEVCEVSDRDRGERVGFGICRCSSGWDTAGSKACLLDGLDGAEMERFIAGGATGADR